MFRPVLHVISWLTSPVPRNCRFLQGNYTDRSATKRLRASIEAREETVELLLNYRKNGEPFWNLLYVGGFNVGLQHVQNG